LEYTGSFHWTTSVIEAKVFVIKNCETEEFEAEVQRFLEIWVAAKSVEACIKTLSPSIQSMIFFVDKITELKKSPPRICTDFVGCQKWLLSDARGENTFAGSFMMMVFFA
jgi:hypothetical protein